VTAPNFISPGIPYNVKNGITTPLGFPEGWAINTNNSSAPIMGGSSYGNFGVTTPTYYSDMDGVIRPGDGAFFNAGTGDGVMLSTAVGSPKGPASPNTTSATDATITQHGRRPVILNRPFRSVGELGYVFRDMPFKTLDFFSASSADAALLDLFSITDESNIVASQINTLTSGQINISNAPAPVIEALLSVAAKKEIDPTYNMLLSSSSTNTDASTVATAIANALNPATGPNPLLNRASLVTSLGPAIQSAFPPSSAGGTATPPDQDNKAYFEAPVRALADVTNTRTWNLMIDIIAQAGQMSSNATTLDNFVVQGEKRYWLHIAIDRYTGKIVDQQLEPVYE
jgi:hypothetical protein